MKKMICFLILLLITMPVSAQDWYEQDYDPYWYADGWDNQNYYPDPNVYSPMYYDPYHTENYGIGSADYVPEPVYPTEETFSDMDWNQNEYNADQWFYEEGFGLDLPGWETSADLPAGAYVDGFVGYAQSYTLDCETRSAIDLAAFYGVNIPHSEFLNSLPHSDDPNLGFVGNFNDPRGQIPPASYGVYQEPIAGLLRNYGLNAIGVEGYTVDSLKSQLAKGKPVMVWIIGNTITGTPVSYTPSNGRTTTVAHFQHTAVVIGYDAQNVTIQDGANKYLRSWEVFEQSWGVLNNRAVVIL